MDYRVETKNSD